MSLTERILEGLKAEPAPRNPRHLAEILGVTSGHVRTRISQMLRDGKLKASDIPWRRRLRKMTSKDVEGRLEEIIAENGSDRVAAANALLNARAAAGSAFKPPVPDDRAGMIRALSQILTAAGRAVSTEAMAISFPARDILPVEASNGGAAADAPEAERSDIGAS